MKGPLKKGELFVVLEYMKGGQVVTHPCAPLQKIEFFIRSPSPSPKPGTPPPPSPVVEVPSEPQVVAHRCPKPRHTTKVAAKAAATGQLMVVQNGPKDFRMGGG